MIEKKQKLRGRCGRKGPIDGQREFQVPPAPENIGYIYFLPSPDYEAMKIGYATDIDHRLQHLQTAHHEELEFEFVMRGTRKDEHRIHQMFAKQRLKGEWFSYDTALANFVDDLAEAAWCLQLSEPPCFKSALAYRNEVLI